MSQYRTSTARDPRGTTTDPERDVIGHQTIDGTAHDVLSCGHRFATTTEPLPPADEGVTATNVRRCPDCVVGP